MAYSTGRRLNQKAGFQGVTRDKRHPIRLIVYSRLPFRAGLLPRTPPREITETQATIGNLGSRTIPAVGNLQAV
jgi:hypothetical protein